VANVLQSKGLRALLMLFFLAVIVGSCVLTLQPDERTAEEERAYQLQSAMIRCENETKSRIADSSGMSVDSYAEWRGLPLEQGEGYRFVYGLRAKNPFGVLTPAVATCEVAYDGEYWSVTDLTLE
jgi:hypothetical protein